MGSHQGLFPFSGVPLASDFCRYPISSQNHLPYLKTKQKISVVKIYSRKKLLFTIHKFDGKLKTIQICFVINIVVIHHVSFVLSAPLCN